MTRFLLIRHAETNATGKRLSGRNKDVHINDEGNAQAQKLAERLTKYPIDAIYSSSLERTIETAAAIEKCKAIKNIVCDDFLEIDFGLWTNCLFTDLEKDPIFKRFNEFRSCTRIPGGETMLEAQSRMVSGLEKLKIKHPHQTVAVISHADMIKAAIAFYAGIHLDVFHRLEISPCSISIIELYDETAIIKSVNDTGKIF